MELLELVYGAAVDPDIKGQSIDEWILGYEAELLPNWTFGISGVYRHLNRLVEDGGAFWNPELGSVYS